MEVFDWLMEEGGLFDWVCVYANIAKLLKSGGKLKKKTHGIPKESRAIS